MGKSLEMFSPNHTKLKQTAEYILEIVSIYDKAHQPRSWKWKKMHTYPCQIMVENKIMNRKGRNKREMKHNLQPNMNYQRSRKETSNTGCAAGACRKGQ
jgi:hypothetical protein